MMDKVYIYRQPVPGFYEEDLVKLCEESWRRNGWTVVQTALADAKMHSRWDAINANKAHLTRGKQFPDRTMVSYYKWLAFETTSWLNERSQSEGALAVDFDIINYGFTPEIAQIVLKGCDDDRIQILGEYGYSFDKEPYLRPPTPVYCSDSSLACQMVEAFVGYRDDSPEAEAAKRKRPNSALMQGVDEQSIINDIFWDTDLIEHVPYCPMYRSEHYETVPWEKAFLVHYTNWSVAKRHVQDRYKTIMRERPPF